MNIALYMRMSTNLQENSIDGQRQALQHYAKSQKHKIVKEYIDEGISGRNALKRPAFMAMISDSEKGEFQAVLIYDSSRFARNLEESIVYKSLLKKNNVALISATEPAVDEDTSLLTDALFGAMNEMYSRKLSLNVRRGMTQKAMLGGTQASPPLGYDLLNKGDIYTINKKESSYIKHIFNEYMKGTSKWKIAKELLLMNATTKKGKKISTRNIDYILSNPVYAGYARWTPDKKTQWNFQNESTITTKAKHKSIISKEFFDSVQKKVIQESIMHKNKERPAETKKHWLSGLIKCKTCGSSLTYNGTSKTKKYASFRCGGYNKGVCNEMNFITTERAEKLVTNYLEAIFKDINILHNSNVNNSRNVPTEIENITKQIEKESKKYTRAKLGFIENLYSIEEYKELKLEIEKNKTKLESTLSQLKKPILYDNLHANIKNVLKTLNDENNSTEIKLKITKTIIEKIIFSRKEEYFNIIFYC